MRNTDDLQVLLQVSTFLDVPHTSFFFFFKQMGVQPANLMERQSLEVTRLFLKILNTIQDKQHYSY